MAEMNINPNAGVGVITLGSTQNEVRGLIRETPQSFKRTEQSEWPCDYFEKLGVFVYYQKPGVVEAIELCRPASAITGSLDLLRIPAVRAIEHLRELDSDLEVTEDSFISHKLGIGGYVPDMDEQDSVAESVIFFRDGYYG